MLVGGGHGSKVHCSNVHAAFLPSVEPPHSPALTLAAACNWQRLYLPISLGLGRTCGNCGPARLHPPLLSLPRSKEARRQKLKESAAKMKASQKSESASASE